MRRFSVILIEEEKNSYRSAQVLLCFLIVEQGLLLYDHELPFLKHLKIPSLLDNVDDILEYVCLRWAEDNGMHHSYHFWGTISKNIEAEE